MCQMAVKNDSKARLGVFAPEIAFDLLRCFSFGGNAVTAVIDRRIIKRRD